MHDDEIIQAQSRINQQATIKSGLLRGTVTIRACKFSYGHWRYLVENDRAEREWVGEKTLEFSEQK